MFVVVDVVVRILVISTLTDRIFRLSCSLVNAKFTAPVTQPQFPAGHCCLDAIPQFTVNNNTWARSTTLLFVEQPVGTGFSYGNAFPENERDVSGDLDQFLQNFYHVFPNLRRHAFFVTGESYAGMFVPSVARHIHLENKKAIKLAEKEKQTNKKNGHEKKIDENAPTDDEIISGRRIIIPLAGASLGNGWIEAETQGPAVIDYSWWHGLIDKPTRDALHTAWENCQILQSGEETMDHYENATLSFPFHPFTIQDDCGLMWGVLQGSGYPNAYDVTTWDPNVDQVTFASEVFYNNPMVRKALHAPGDIVWHGCRQGGGRRRLGGEDAPHQYARNFHRKLYMDNEKPVTVVPYIADLVNDGIPVIVYNGDRDMTTNMVGTELALNRMEWKGSGDAWLNAPRGLWMVGGHQAGWSKEYGNLTFVTVYNSGHMVPYNVPEPAFDLLNRLLTHKSFMDIPLPQVRVEPFRKKVAERHSERHSDHHQKEIEVSLVEGLAIQSQSGDGMNAIAQSNNYLPMMGVSAVSMVFGFVLALFMVRRTSNRGYQRLPEASME